MSGVSGWWQLSPWSAWAPSAGPQCALSPHRTRPLQARQRDARCRRLPERGLGAATLGLPVSQQSSQHAPTTSAVITIQERWSLGDPGDQGHGGHHRIHPQGGQGLAAGDTR